MNFSSICCSRIPRHHLVLSTTVVVFVLMMNKSSMPSSIVLMASQKPTLIGTVYCTVFSGKTYVVCSCRRLFGNEPPLYEFSKYIHVQVSNHSILNLFMHCLFMVAEINFLIGWLFTSSIPILFGLVMNNPLMSY